MGLSKSIVVVNEYTIKNASGKGSRGSSPSNYITNYMARDKATETLTPVRLLEQEDYILRYMSREDAVEKLDDREVVKPEMKSMQKYGGLAFGYDSISLSDEKLKQASKDIQKNFDNGKTVMKTILSFDEDYLRENKIIDSDFSCNKRGDYRGNIDQMKLRMAIMNGMLKFSRDYDDLQYIGVLQVDTEHVHCHLAMTDRGKGNITADGTQRGKISTAQKNNIRRGIDLFLDENKTVQHMCSNIDYDKRNTSIFIKQVSHKTINQNGMSQLLIACLPEDKRLWRASSNTKAMQKANTLTREYVQELFKQPDSNYDKVQKSIYKYAETRKSREDLTGEQFRKLIKTGERNIENECINSIYDIMQSLEKRDKNIRTPMLDMLSKNVTMSVSKNSDEFGEFTYKLRSYSTRLEYHKSERDKAHTVVENYNKAAQDNQVSDDAKVLYDFFKFEEDYNEKLMCKYQHFLHFIPSDKKHEQELKDLLDYKQKLSNLDKMYNDKSIKKMKAENAEDYGERVYEQRGGRYMTFAPDIIDTRRNLMKEKLLEKDKAFAYKLTTDALVLDYTDTDTDIPKFKKNIKHTFAQTKALDLHHLNYDSPTDMPVSQNNIDIFLQATRLRTELAQAAREYLELSGQDEELEKINSKDIRLMQQVAAKLETKNEIKSARLDDVIIKPSKTISLDKKFDLSIPVKQSLLEIEIRETEDDNFVSRRHRY